MLVMLKPRVAWQVPSTACPFSSKEKEAMESKLPDWEYGTWDRKNLMLIASADFLWQYDNMLKKKSALWL